MSRNAEDARVCPFCSAARQPSLCALCLNQMTRERYEALAHLQSTKHALEKRLAQRVAHKERQAVRRAQQEEGAIRRQRHARRMQHEQAQLREERSRIGDLRLSVAARLSRLEHAVSVMGRLSHSSAATLASAQASPLSPSRGAADKEGGIASSAPHVGLEADQGLLNRLMLVTTARRKQAKDFLRELKEVLPLRLAMSVPTALTRGTVLSAGGVRICNMPLPTSNALLCTLPSVELSTALGCFLQFLDLTAKYLCFPLLHRAGFGASTSRIWQRSSYWSPFPGEEYPLFKKGTLSMAHPGRASEEAEGAGAHTVEQGHPHSMARAASLGQPQGLLQGYPQQGQGGIERGETPWRQYSMGGGPQWDGYQMAEGSEDVPSAPELSTFSLASTSSSLFESPSWHALPRVAPPGAAPLAGAWGSNGRPQGQGDPWQGQVPDNEVLQLKEGVLLLARSVACLCASHTFQPHGSQAPRSVVVPVAHEGEVLGELGEALVPFFKMLSALIGEPRLGSDGASELDSRGDAQGEVSSSMMASAAWEEGSFIGRDAGAGRPPAALHALSPARQLRPAALAPSAQALHDRHYESCSRLAHHQAQLGQAGGRAFADSPIGLEAERRCVLGSSLVPDYIPPPLGERMGVPQPIPSSGQAQARQLGFGRRGFGIKLPLVRLLGSAASGVQGQAFARDRTQGRSAEDEWDLVERVTLPPPPSRPEDVEHWTRATILDVAK